MYFLCREFLLTFLYRTYERIRCSPSPSGRLSLRGAPSTRSGAPTESSRSLKGGEGGDFRPFRGCVFLGTSSGLILACGLSFFPWR